MPARRLTLAEELASMLWLCFTLFIISLPATYPTIQTILLEFESSAIAYEPEVPSSVELYPYCTMSGPCVYWDFPDIESVSLGYADRVTPVDIMALPAISDQQYQDEDEDSFDFTFSMSTMDLHLSEDSITCYIVDFGPQDVEQQHTFTFYLTTQAIPLLVFYWRFVLSCLPTRDDLKTVALAMTVFGYCKGYHHALSPKRLLIYLNFNSSTVKSSLRALFVQIIGSFVSLLLCFATHAAYCLAQADKWITGSVYATTIRQIRPLFASTFTVALVLVYIIIALSMDQFAIICMISWSCALHCCSQYHSETLASEDHSQTLASEDNSQIPDIDNTTEIMQPEQPQVPETLSKRSYKRPSRRQIQRDLDLLLQVSVAQVAYLRHLDQEAIRESKKNLEIFLDTINCCRTAEDFADPNSARVEYLDAHGNVQGPEASPSDVKEDCRSDSTSVTPETVIAWRESLLASRTEDCQVLTVNRTTIKQVSTATQFRFVPYAKPSLVTRMFQTLQRPTNKRTHRYPEAVTQSTSQSHAGSSECSIIHTTACTTVSHMITEIATANIEATEIATADIEVTEASANTEVASAASVDIEPLHGMPVYERSCILSSEDKATSATPLSSCISDCATGAALPDTVADSSDVVLKQMMLHQNAGEDSEKQPSIQLESVLNAIPSNETDSPDLPTAFSMDDGLDTSMIHEAVSAKQDIQLPEICITPPNDDAEMSFGAIHLALSESSNGTIIPLTTDFASPVSQTLNLEHEMEMEMEENTFSSIESVNDCMNSPESLHTVNTTSYDTIFDDEMILAETEMTIESSGTPEISMQETTASDLSFCAQDDFCPASDIVESHDAVMLPEVMPDCIADAGMSYSAGKSGFDDNDQAMMEVSVAVPAPPTDSPQTLQDMAYEYFNDEQITFLNEQIASLPPTCLDIDLDYGEPGDATMCTSGTDDPEQLYELYPALFLDEQPNLQTSGGESRVATIDDLGVDTSDEEIGNDTLISNNKHNNMYKGTCPDENATIAQILGEVPFAMPNDASSSQCHGPSVAVDYQPSQVGWIAEQNQAVDDLIFGHDSPSESVALLPTVMEEKRSQVVEDEKPWEVEQARTRDLLRLIAEEQSREPTTVIMEDIPAETSADSSRQVGSAGRTVVVHRKWKPSKPAPKPTPSAVALPAFATSEGVSLPVSTNDLEENELNNPPARTYAPWEAEQAMTKETLRILGEQRAAESESSIVIPAPATPSITEGPVEQQVVQQQVTNGANELLIDPLLVSADAVLAMNAGMAASTALQQAEAQGERTLRSLPNRRKKQGGYA